jgi:hypothetical protein
MPEQKTVVTKEEMSNVGAEGLALKRAGDEITLRVVVINLPPGVHRYPH